MGNDDRIISIVTHIENLRLFAWHWSSQYVTWSQGHHLTLVFCCLDCPTWLLFWRQRTIWTKAQAPQRNHRIRDTSKPWSHILTNFYVLFGIDIKMIPYVSVCIMSRFLLFWGAKLDFYAGWEVAEIGLVMIWKQINKHRLQQVLLDCGDFFDVPLNRF